MRITATSWMLVLAGGALFGAGLIGLARVLPSHDARAQSVTIFDGGTGVVLTPAAVAPDAPAGVSPMADAQPQPPSMPADGGDVPPASAALRVLDLQPVDETLRDRNGNAPKRALTAGELQDIALAYDVVVDDLAGQPDGGALTAEEIGAMHAINPRVRVVRLLETLTSNDPAYGSLRPDDGTHSEWFLRDGTGEPALAYGGNAAWNGEPNFAMDPANTGVRTAIAARARQFTLLGYDGVWLAGASSHAPDFRGAAAIEPASGVVYGDGAWRAAALGMIAGVRRLIPHAVIYVAAADVDAAFAADAQVIGAGW